MPSKNEGISGGNPTIYALVTARNRAADLDAANLAECTIESMTEPAAPLDQQLEEIGAQLAWVRDYL
jgi:hypothetical protein